MGINKIRSLAPYFVTITVLLILGILVYNFFQAPSKEGQIKPELITETISQLQTTKNSSHLVGSTDSTSTKQASEKIQSSNQNIQNILDKLNSQNLNEVQKSRIKKSLAQLLNYNEYSSCLLFKLDTDQQLETKSIQLFESKNFNELRTVQKDRIENLSSAENCFGGEKSIFSLNSTLTDLQRNKFLLEELSASLERYSKEEYAEKISQVNFFKSRNLQSLQNQANLLLDKEISNLG